MLSRNRELLLEVKAELDTLKTALIVMDPKVKTSSDAYEGLRKQVAASASSRQAHLVQLAQFSRALRRGASLDDLKHLVDQWCQQAGLVAVTEPNPELFEVLEGEAGVGDFVMVSPAYVDPTHNRLVAMGEARWLDHPVADGMPIPSAVGSEGGAFALSHSGDPVVVNREADAPVNRDAHDEEVIS